MRSVRVAFIGAMAILIVLTLAQTFVPFLPVAPLQEYRKPVPPPDVLGTIMNGDGRLASGINAWFDDQVGFRSILTRAANEIDISFEDAAHVARRLEFVDQNPHGNAGAAVLAGRAIGDCLRAAET